MINKIDNTEEEKPPFLNTWKSVYGLVIVTLITVILLLYFFSQHFK